jgi:hypothetical protein
MPSDTGFKFKVEELGPFLSCFTILYRHLSTEALEI